MEYMEVLGQKLEALTRILEATERLTLTNTDDEATLEREAALFSSLYEQREGVVDEIKEIDEALAEFTGIEETAEAEAIKAKIRDTAKAIAALDKKHLEMSKVHSDFFKGNLKKIRGGRTVSNAYNEPEPTSGYYIDRKN